MQKTFYGLFSRLVYGLSLIFSAYLLYLSVWHVWNGETLDWRLILLLSGAAGALLFGLCRFLQGHEKLADRLWKLCIYIGVPLYTAGLIWYSARMTIIPQYDLNEVQAEALRLAAGGTGAWSSYFMTFPHQIPVTLILAAAYRLGMAVGVNDFYMAGNAANALALGLSALGTLLLAGRLMQKPAAITVFLFFVCNPIWFLYVSWTSTDTFCIPFALWGLYFLIKSEEKGYRPAFLAAGFGLLFVSMGIRAVNIVLVIAWFLHLCFRENRRNIAKAALMAALIYAGLTAAYRGVCSAVEAPYDSEARFPVSHWVMMGLNRDTAGSFAEADYQFTLQTEGYEAKKEKTMEQAAERLQEMGAGGLLAHGAEKLRLTWSEGYCIESTWYNVKAPGTVYDFSVGTRSGGVQYLCQVFRVLLFAGLLGASCRGLLTPQLLERRHSGGKISGAFLMTAFLGAIAFYLLWESGQRYSLSFIPWLNIGAAAGLAGWKKISTDK